jgi:hypothetical protein
VTEVVVVIALQFHFRTLLNCRAKCDLTGEDHYAVQPIYYPHYTIGGGSDPLCAACNVLSLTQQTGLKRIARSDELFQRTITK